MNQITIDGQVYDCGIDFGEDNSFKGNILIVDFSNLAYHDIFAILPGEPDRERAWYAWKGKIVEDLLYFASEFKPDRIILAIDSKDNWRKKIYPEYKMTVSRANAKVAVDKERYDVEIISMIKELKESFGNIYFIKVDNSEADDIIAVITKKENSNNTNIIIISADHDFCQLAKYENVSQHEPSRKLKKIEVINPKQHIDIKMIIGDKNDNIDSIRYGVGPKTAATILVEGINVFASKFQTEKDKIIEKYNRNRTLINFDYIPKEIENSILNEYNNCKLGRIDNMNLISLFAYNNRCQQRWNSGLKELFYKLR